MAIDVERLIACVRSQVFLYDLGHKDYKNTSRKAEVWETIAEELNENSETVKLKWKTVRDGYIKFKKQQKDGTSKKSINYIWSSHLKFLDDYQVSRKSKTPNVSLSTALQLSEDESETPSQSYSPASILIPSPSDSGPFRSEHDTTTATRRRRRDQDKNGGYVKNKKSKKEKTKDNYDATDHLFLSYSETFKTFTPRQQALLKVELAKLFSTAELNALQNAENLQESFVAGSSPIYSLVKSEANPMLSATQDIHTVEDDDTDDDDIELVPPTQGRRRRRARHASDATS